MAPHTIYLDNNATTRPHPAVIEEMSRHWGGSFGNPGSRHLPGRRARQVLEASRESIAAILGADPEEVVFTSGGTESNNLALRGFARRSQGRIALTAAEHPSVMETFRDLEIRGWTSQILPVDGEGRLTASAPEIAAGAQLVSVILAHNETGVIQDVSPIAEACQARGIPFHVDAVQAVGKIPVDFHGLGATSLALGAHKFHGPRGIGALLLREGAAWTPSFFGGHQEAGRRPGTEPVALIAGMACALELFNAEQKERQQRLCAWRDRLEQALSELCAPVLINGSRDHRLPNTLNVGFPGVDGEALLIALDLEGIACSLGSTCASGSAEPAPALIAMNRPESVLRSSVRFSLGIDNTDDEIVRAGHAIAQTVLRLREGL